MTAYLSVPLARMERVLGFRSVNYNDPVGNYKVLTWGFLAIFFLLVTWIKSTVLLVMKELGDIKMVC